MARKQKISGDNAARFNDAVSTSASTISALNSGGGEDDQIKSTWKMNINSIDFEVDEHRFDGAITQGRLTLNGARFSCWAVDKATSTGPDGFAVFIGGSLLRIVEPMVVRHDIAGLFGESALNSGAELDIALDDIPRPILPEIEVYAFERQSLSATNLPKALESYWLDRLIIRNDVDFVRLIQSPATRLSDESQLLYASAHALKRFSDNFYICSGAICVIGYRIIHRFPVEAECNALFDRELERLLAWPGAVPQGTRVRWSISMLLTSAYVSLFRNDLATAESQLQKIVDYTPSMKFWPSSLTNILLGHYGLAYLALIAGNTPKALSLWEQCKEVFKLGCEVADFKNVYSYGELGNALKVAEECHICYLVTKNGEVISDPNLGPVGTRLDPKRLPAPLGWLLPTIAT